MDKELLLVIVGGLVGLVSSMVGAVLTHRLDGKRLEVQLERESALRRAEREREDQLRREEREREDQLRREEREREDQLRREERHRQSVLRQVDALWRDIERTRQAIASETNLATQESLRRQLADLSKWRQQLLDEDRQLLRDSAKQPTEGEQ